MTGFSPGKRYTMAKTENILDVLPLIPVYLYIIFYSAPQATPGQVVGFP